MIRHLRHLVLLGLILLIAGGHVAVLQVAAWGGMLATRIHERSLTEAVDSTFSGDEPCALCMAARALNDDDREPISPEKPQKPVKNLKIVKVEVPPSSAIQVLVPMATTDERGFVTETHGRSLVWIPEPPPPKA